MIAVVSSTMAPDASLCRDGVRTLFSVDERVEQTRVTLNSLTRIGITSILIMDNSPENVAPRFARHLSQGRVIHCPQPSFSNRGLGELWLLLAALPYIADGVPVLKLSARYYLEEDSPLSHVYDADFVGRAYGSRKSRTVSTRAYVLRDKSVAESLWRGTLEEMYAGSGRIVGPRSAWKLLRQALSVGPTSFPGGEPSVSVERSLYKASSRLALRPHLLPRLGLKGVIAGASQTPIDE